jgi:hypothetical protein
MRHLKNDGHPCRTPAMGQREFCVFHTRGYDCETNQRIKVGFLEDRNSLQLVLKQIMEQLLTGRIEPQTAALLLRATQVANGVLKGRKSTHARCKPIRSATRGSQSNPEEFAGNPAEKSGLCMPSDGLRTARDFSADHSWRKT